MEDPSIEAANDAYLALQSVFRAGYGLYRETHPPLDGDPYSYLWPHSQTMAAILLMARAHPGEIRFLEDARVALAGLQHYLDEDTHPEAYESCVRPPLGTGGDKFYDDNAWIGLDLLELFHLTGSPRTFAAARQVLQFVASGWEDDPSLPLPGGVRWTSASSNGDRNTVSTAAGAQLALRMYLHTGTLGYLRSSQKMCEWVEAYMRSPEGLYWDHVDRRGAIDRTIWSYNQGLMLGVYALLHLATGEGSYLEQAASVADASLSHHEPGDGWSLQPPIFNAIYWSNLMALDELAPHPPRTEAFASYVTYLLQHRLDPSTGLLRTGENHPVHLVQQAGLVQTLALATTRGETRLTSRGHDGAYPSEQKG